MDYIKASIDLTELCIWIDPLSKGLPSNIPALSVLRVKVIPLPTFVLSLLPSIFSFHLQLSESKYLDFGLIQIAAELYS